MSTDQLSKQLNEMDRLSDIACLPGSVFICVAINTSLTVFVTSYVHSRYWQLAALCVWLVAVVLLNVLPIALIRLVSLKRASICPVLKDVAVTRDLYKMSDWVYAIYAFYLSSWIAITWIALTYRNTDSLIVELMVCGFVFSLIPSATRLFSVFSRRQGDTKAHAANGALQPRAEENTWDPRS